MHLRNDSLELTSRVLQQLSTLILILAAICLTVSTLGALFGVLPWLELVAVYGSSGSVALGIWVQIGLTLFSLALLGFLPTNARVRQLEVTNRNFHISMEDVALAYNAVHQADRNGTFELSREFDEMRDRIAWMREHPDLAELEPDILEVAAQMSVESRDLARIYSSERVSRAHTFLRQRQQEIEDYRQRISMAQATVHEIKRWMHAIDVDEGLAEKQLERLQLDLDEITDSLEIVEEIVPQNVVQIERPKAKAAPAKQPGKKKAARPSVSAARQTLLSSEDEETEADLEILFKG